MKPQLLSLSAVLLSLVSIQAHAALPGDPIVSEDFESTAVGSIPAGFAKTGAVAVAEGSAHGGKHALKMDAAVKGGRFITLKGDKLKELGGEHWGRMYYKVELPAPLPVIPEGKTSAIIHSTMVNGKGLSPLMNDLIDLRLVSQITNMKGEFNYIYNVQPPNGRKEFSHGQKAKQAWSDQWTLVEWHVDNATQTFEYFINGQEVPEMEVHNGAGKFEGAEIPAVFDSLSFGFTNYQPASGTGFVTWIDDLALSKKRIGPTK